MFRILFFKRMHPIRLKIIDRKDQCTQAPCDRIRPGNRLQHGEEVHSNGHIGDADDTPAQQHDEHRHGRFTRATEDCRHTMRIRQQEEERRGRALMQHAISDGCRVVGEKTD